MIHTDRCVTILIGQLSKKRANEPSHTPGGMILTSPKTNFCNVIHFFETRVSILYHVLSCSKRHFYIVIIFFNEFLDLENLKIVMKPLNGYFLSHPNVFEKASVSIFNFFCKHALQVIRIYITCGATCARVS